MEECVGALDGRVTKEMNESLLKPFFRRRGEEGSFPDGTTKSTWARWSQCGFLPKKLGNGGP